jgi:uncharacterized protein YjbJ (UPF0337 family)
MKREPVKGVADKVTKGVEKDLTGRAVNEPQLQAEGKADKLRGDARTAEGGVSDGAHRATEESGRVVNQNRADKPE